MTLAPMTLREAIECAKILVPYMADLRQAESGLDLVELVLTRVGGDEPTQVLRMLALMEHRSLQEVVLDYQPQGAEAMLRALSEGMRVNPVPDLMEAAYLMRLTDERWSGGPT